MGTEDERQKASSFLYFMLTVIDSFTKRQEKEREKKTETNYLEIKEKRLKRTSTMNEHKSNGLHYNSVYPNENTNVSESLKHFWYFPSNSFPQYLIFQFLVVGIKPIKKSDHASYVHHSLTTQRILSITKCNLLFQVRHLSSVRFV